jgi:hypothetical protein
LPGLFHPHIPVPRQLSLNDHSGHAVYVHIPRTNPTKKYKQNVVVTLHVCVRQQDIYMPILRPQLNIYLIYITLVAMTQTIEG